MKGNFWYFYNSPSTGSVQGLRHAGHDKVEEEDRTFNNFTHTEKDHGMVENGRPFSEAITKPDNIDQTTAASEVETSQKTLWTTSGTTVRQGPGFLADFRTRNVVSSTRRGGVSPVYVPSETGGRVATTSSVSPLVFQSVLSYQHSTTATTSSTSTSASSIQPKSQPLVSRSNSVSANILALMVLLCFISNLL